MSDYKVDTRDIQFVLFEQCKLADLGRFEAFSEFDRETYEIMLNEAVKFATQELGPVNPILDRKGLEWKDGKVVTPEEHKAVYEKFKDGGWIGTSLPQDWGGLGLPWVFDAALGEIFSGGSMAFAMTPGLTKGATALVINFASDHLKELYAEKMTTGEWTGTMCLTEPQAGSAVGDTKATAEPVPGKDYYLFRGTKIFISAGEHDLTENIVHLVLGRLPGAPKGTKGLSLFLIPKLRPTEDGGLEPNDVYCSGIEEKLGIHGSPTTTLNFGDNDDCRAWLIGEPNQGMRLMFHMMNEARIFVGIQGVSQANAAYQVALEYAKERVQGVDIKKMRDPDAPKVTIDKHPDVRLNLMHMRVMSEGMRALAAKACTYSDIANNAEGKEAEKAQFCANVLTPIVKAFITDQAFRVTEKAMQVLGGYGYCFEYGVEQYLRDCKITSIYEGTNGIQALDLVGRKITRKKGLMYLTLQNEMVRFIMKHKKDEELGPMVAALEKAKNGLAAVTLDFGKKGLKDIEYPVLNATDYLELFGIVTLGWVILEQAVIAKQALARLDEEGADEQHPDRAFYARKLANARFYVSRILPKADYLVKVIKGYDRTPLDAEI